MRNLLKFAPPARIIAGSFNEKRSAWVRGAFALAFVAILGRAIAMYVFPPSPEFLNRLAKHQYSKKIQLAPYRGNIYDRRGEPLAISIKKPSFFVNPKQFDPTPAEIAWLAKLLQQPAAKVKKIADQDSYFYWLKRQASPEQAAKLRLSSIKGLFEVREPARFYPLGEAAAHILGFVGVDSQGLGGLERSYDHELRGSVTDYTPAIDAHGSKIYLDSQYAIPYQPGSSLSLTIDRVIQEIAEEELEQGVRAAAAKGGSVIVSDPHTGQILAMANYPKFDPQNISGRDMTNTNNRAVVDIFEPGSITKPFVIATALDKGQIRLNDQHNCEKSGHLRVGGRIINDDHPHEFLDTAGVLVKSSNICMYKIAKNLTPVGLHQSLSSFGIGHPQVRLGYSGEVGGRIASPNGWKEIRFANVAFGQGFSVTALEMASAYGAIANGGQLLRPYIVTKIVTPEGVQKAVANPTIIGQAMKPQTAAAMRRILEEVTLTGTGTKAQTPFYTVAGKTGTAEVYDPQAKRYSLTKRKSSFVGFAPAGDPHLVVFVMIDEPTQKPYYGGLWAAPVFSEITSRVLDYLNVKPDKLAVGIHASGQPEAKPL